MTLVNRNGGGNSPSLFDARRKKGKPVANAYKPGLTGGLPRKKLIVLILVLGCVLYLKDVFSSFSSAAAAAEGYVVVIDAGSSGSRAHVFHAVHGVVDPRHESLKTKPGLSSYASSPHDAGKALAPLMEFARKHVPASEMKHTRIILKATAGMRLLPEKDSRAIIQDVQQYLSTTGFAFSHDDAEIIDGKEEGLLGWISINYLNEEPGTWGVIEMGGASVQVTLKAAKGDHVPKEHQRNYNDPTSGKSGTVFTHSFLGLGIESARGSVNEVLIKTSATTDPCLQTGFVVGAERSPLSGVSTAIPEGNFDACSKLISDTLYKSSSNEKCVYSGGCLYNGMYAPKLDLNGKLWAFENFFYAASALGMSGVPGVIVVDDFARAGRENCAMGWEEMDAAYPKDTQPKELNENWCFGMAHLHSFFINALKFAPDQEVMISNNVGENGIDWALGAALQAMKSKPKSLRSQHQP